jgi:hypothetical protein
VAERTHFSPLARAYVFFLVIAVAAALGRRMLTFSGAERVDFAGL